ncbi:MAG: DHH family phosphoesterase [Thermoplasmata archaeon]|nr:MAG: DHH family phosphoesterase [Thermoplasmata archaeon]
MGDILIHHWDTDGICSAHLLMKHLGAKIRNITPQIGNYYLTDEEMDMLGGFDGIFIVDMALPEDNIKRLSRSSEVTVYDHHVQSYMDFIHHINPVAKGSRQEDYPSCTWVLKEHFKIDTDLQVVLGIIGDNEHKIEENRRFYEIVRKFCDRFSTTLEDLVRAVHLIDSNYKLGKKDAVEKIPHYIGEMSIDDILNCEDWNRNLETIEKEIERALNKRQSVGKNLEMIDIESPYNVISEITRRLAWSTGKNAVVINRGFFPDKSQIYVRTSTTDLSNLISKLKSMGYNVGGKPKVLGAIVSKNSTDMVVNEVVKFLEGEN